WPRSRNSRARGAPTAPSTSWQVRWIQSGSSVPSTEPPASKWATISSPGERLVRHRRAADLAKQRRRRAIALLGLVEAAERGERMAADVRERRLQVAVAEAVGELARLPCPRERLGSVAALQRDVRDVAEHVGVGEALADLGADPAAGLEDLERRVVVAERALGLA